MGSRRRPKFKFLENTNARTTSRLKELHPVSGQCRAFNLGLTVRRETRNSENRMNATPPRFEIDRAYDLRVPAALPPTLGLFAQAALRAQLHEMSKQRRAICFTLMTPVAHQAPLETGEAAARVATILVCLHIAPVLANEGLEAVLGIVSQVAGVEGDPIHQLGTPVAEAGTTGTGFYREARSPRTRRPAFRRTRCTPSPPWSAAPQSML
jgi:hypothetical protein